MTTDLTLNGVALSTAVPDALVLRVSRRLVGETRDVEVDLPGRAGSWRFDEEPGDRILEVEIDIQSTSFEARRAAVRALAVWAAPGTTTPLIVSDEPDRYEEAILSRSPEIDEWLVQGGGKIRFDVGPYALALAPSTTTIAASGSPDSGSFSVDIGTAEAELIVEITPTNGTITSLSLGGWGGSVEWQADDPGDPHTLLEDQTLTISAISQTVTFAANVDVMLTGAFDPDDVDMANVAISGSFPILVDGSNDWVLSWTGTATTVDIVYTWRERFT